MVKLGAWAILGWMVFLAMVARSRRRVGKLCASNPSEVRLVKSLAMAASDR